MSTATTTSDAPKIHQGIEAAATGRVTRINQKENVTFVGLACNRGVKNAEGKYEDKTTFLDAKLVGDAHKSTDFSQIKQGTLLELKGPLDSGRPYKDASGQDRQSIDLTVFKADQVKILGQPKGDAARAKAGVAAATVDGEPPF